MKSCFLLAIALAFAFLLASSGYTEQSAEELYQSGLYEEQIKGELDRAIEIYRTIVSKYPENRSAVAKALLHIGLCYEKLGKQEAQKVYRRVIEEFADQKAVATEARTRLAALEQPAGPAEAKGIVVRQMWTGDDVDLCGAVSPDGRYLSFVDWETGDLAIREIATGKARRLTNKGSWDDSNEYALFSRWSSDGRKIAYTWQNKDGVFGLRTVGLDGSAPHVLYTSKGEISYNEPTSWSPDGKQVLVKLLREDESGQMALISVADGSVRVLKDLPLGWAYFSPDGRHIAYSRNGDIFLRSADGSRDTPLVEHPANDYVLGWASDGKSILFTSDRTGTSDAWAVPVSEGTSQGAPKLIKRDIGKISSMGFTREGTWFYGLRTGTQDVYVAALHRESGEISSPPRKASQRFEGSNTSPDWSPDGQYLAYVSRREHSAFYLCIRTLKTGEEREFFPKFKRMYRPRWSPDGRSILVYAAEQNNRRGLYQIDAQTGDVTSIVQYMLNWIPEYTWSLGGKAILYTCNVPDTDLMRILMRELETGTENELYRSASPGYTGKLALSPDGRWLAFCEANLLRVMPTAGGKARKLIEPGQISAIAWTDDGQDIFLVKGWPNTELWRIPASGGEARKLGLAMDRIRHLRVHPDGQQIAFDSGHANSEVWMMESFLPEN